MNETESKFFFCQIKAKNDGFFFKFQNFILFLFVNFIFFSIFVSKDDDDDDKTFLFLLLFSKHERKKSE